jgi:DNA-directed RNA polymerase sigma subunit (sigma70/sigma32)
MDKLIQIKDDYECVEIIKNEGLPCKQKNCRHSLNSSENLNCSIIAAAKGPMTLQEIGNFYGISRMRVCQIEKTILKKIKNQKNLLDDFDPSS